MTREPYDRKEDASGLRLVAHSDLNGCGDGMHVARKANYAYVAHMGESRVATSIVDVSDPRKPRVVNQLPARVGTHSHKVQIVGDLMAVNHERDPKITADSWTAGISVYDLSSPTQPKELSYFHTPGKGVHRLVFWEMPYAYLTASDTGYDDQFLVIVDLTDPTRPKEVGRWWFPGQWTAGGETPTWADGRTCKLHHAIPVGSRLYCGYWDMGIVILDASDISKPKLISHLEFGSDVSACTHTARPFPGTNMMVVTDEATQFDCQEVRKRVRVVDISNEARPKVVSMLPEPEGDFCSRGLRYGPHNLHEMEPGSLIDPKTVYVTYFNAGLRLYDISDPLNPKEVAYYIPQAPAGQKAAQTNGVYVDAQGLTYMVDRSNGGLYILERV